MKRQKSTTEEINARVSATVREVDRFSTLAIENPDQALREADRISDASIRASALIAIAVRTQRNAYRPPLYSPGRIEPLVEARDILLAADEIPYPTKVHKLSKIAFAAVGIDNVFSAETAREITGPVMGVQMRQQLSVAMTPSIKALLRTGKGIAELNRYPDLVMGAFHESVDDPCYFGKTASPYTYFHVPTHVKWAPYSSPLDPIEDGMSALNAFVGNHKYFKEMSDFMIRHF